MKMFCVCHPLDFQSLSAEPLKDPHSTVLIRHLDGTFTFSDKKPIRKTRLCTTVTREIKVPGVKEPFAQTLAKERLPFNFSWTKLARHLVASVAYAFVEFASDNGPFVLSCDTGKTLLSVGAYSRRRITLPMVPDYVW